MKRNIFAVLVVALTLVLGFAVIVSANNGARADFNAQYHGNSLGSSCNICHTSPPNTNPYGTALVNAGATADNITAATFVAVEGLDSDGDGFSNIDEINAGTFPGDPTNFPSAPSTVDSIVPVEGALGTQLTITGSGFGAKKGKVVLSSASLKAILIVPMGGWTDTIISGTLKKVLPAGPFDVTIYLQPYRTTSPIFLPSAFSIMTPEMDPLLVSSGSPGDEITITGRFFGIKKGKVYIDGLIRGKPKKTICKVTSWSMNATTGVSELRFLVPKGLDPGTYPLTVTNKIETVNTTFTIP